MEDRNSIPLQGGVTRYLLEEGECICFSSVRLAPSQLRADHPAGEITELTAVLIQRGYWYEIKLITAPTLRASTIYDSHFDVGVQGITPQEHYPTARMIYDRIERRLGQGSFSLRLREDQSLRLEKMVR